MNDHAEHAQVSSIKYSPHPAKYSDAILEAMVEHIKPGSKVLDPMAGTGRVHRLRRMVPGGCWTVGTELEVEWAACDFRTLNSNCLSLPFVDNTFDYICVSPVYGNRMSDHHDAKDGSERLTYTHKLGRKLHKDNSGAMQWGKAYRAFHLDAWTESLRVLKPEGIFLLNIKDHIRAGKLQHVTEWHVNTLESLGLNIGSVTRVPCTGMGFGANGDVRVDHENVICMSASFGQTTAFHLGSNGEWVYT